jgi:hypothetical protein
MVVGVRDTAKSKRPAARSQPGMKKGSDQYIDAWASHMALIFQNRGANAWGPGRLAQQAFL